MKLSRRVATVATATLLVAGSLLASATAPAQAATAVPAACRADFNLIAGLRAEVADLQEELKTASPSQKSDIVQQIRALQSEIAVINVRYQQCLRDNGA